MEFKGTKGKWVIEKAPNGLNIDIRENHSGVLYTSISDDFGTDSIHIFGDFRLQYNDLITQIQANALLISKAPEMLEVLQSINSSFDIWDSLPCELQEQIYKVIKEATEI
jgi:hypothetical protein